MIDSILKYADYEYAGFRYIVKDGKLRAAAGQHSAAYKEKHRMNAQEMYDAEQNS